LDQHLGTPFQTGVKSLSLYCSIEEEFNPPS
jgi:hypothetical protein